MGNVIKMDFYRLFKTLSFKVCLIIVCVYNLLTGPFEKLVYNIAKAFAENATQNDPSAEPITEFSTVFHLGNTVAAHMGLVSNIVFLLCIVYFCYADIQHGYIKNIAGQLPSRGHTILSKFTVIVAISFLFYVLSIICCTVGQLLIGRSIKFDMVFSDMLNPESGSKTFSFADALIEFGIHWLLLIGICLLILLLTTAIGSNVAGTIVAVCVGLGVTGSLYMLASTGINQLFKPEKEFDLTQYMPDSLYRSDLFYEGFVVRALIVAVITIAVLLFLTTKIYNKKDIK